MNRWIKHQNGARGGHHDDCARRVLNEAGFNNDNVSQLAGVGPKQLAESKNAEPRKLDSPRGTDARQLCPERS